MARTTVRRRPHHREHRGEIRVERPVVGIDDRQTVSGEQRAERFDQFGPDAQCAVQKIADLRGHDRPRLEDWKRRANAACVARRNVGVVPAATATEPALIDIAESAPIFI